MRQTSRVAPLPEPHAEARGGEGTPISGHQWRPSSAWWRTLPPRRGLSTSSGVDGAVDMVGLLLPDARSAARQQRPAFLQIGTGGAARKAGT
jgi:hypothetical protein